MTGLPSHPLSLADWHEVFITCGPAGAAEIFLKKLAALDPAAQRATLTALPSIPTLQRRFADAWEKRDLPLGGAPFLVKDLYATQGDATGAGSTFLAGLLGPATADASLVAHARDTGAVLCGKTQLNEFALGMSGENPHYGDCPHPRRRHLLSGGSSSGSAFAVGAGLVPFALGTDTSGSIRVPAAFCGLYGLRLQPGLLDTDELFPLAPSFDTPGWLTATAADMRTLTETLLGDACVTTAPPARRLWLDCADTVSPEVRDATTRFVQTLGFATDDTVARFFAQTMQGVEQSYPILGASEAARLHGDWLETYRTDYDPVVWQRLDAGRRRTADEIIHATAHRQAIADCFATLFADWDVIALPVTPLGAQPKSGQTEALRHALLRLNAPASMASLPAWTAPVPLSGGLTTGVQFIFPSLDKLHLCALSPEFLG